MTTHTSSPLAPNFPWVSPYFVVKDVDAATDFYTKAFGFTLREKVLIGEEKVSGHAEMTYHNQLLMFGREGEYQGKKTAKTPNSAQIECPISLYIYCEDVDKFYQHALAQGAKSIDAPADMFWGDRTCRVQCPEGYIWSFATHLGVPCDQLKKSA